MDNDIIYRRAAIDAMTTAIWHYPNELYKGLNQYETAMGLAKMGLLSLPSAEPERKKGKWIPCSKRLPEHDYYGETFQVTIQCEHVDGWDDYVSGYADWTPNGWDIQSYYQGQIKVVAWMLMPEPWKGGQDEHNGTD